VPDLNEALSERVRAQLEAVVCRQLARLEPGTRWVPVTPEEEELPEAGDALERSA
jgi:hypothetical protein